VCLWYTEPTSELPVDSAETDKPAAAADASEQPLSPIHRYVSYDERPLPAMRRSLSAGSFLMILHNQFFCHSAFACLFYCLVLLIFDVYFS